jgi:hypothetical protein
VRLTVVSFLFILALPLTAADHPAVSLINNREIVAILSDLLRLGGSGFRETESAAFIVIEEGGYRCISWAFNSNERRQQFRGTIPAFTVAIAHTHPRYIRLPSAMDQATATRTGIPVVVVTPKDVYVATPEGVIVAAIKRQASWITQDVAPYLSCRAAPPAQRRD